MRNSNASYLVEDQKIQEWNNDVYVTVGRMSGDLAVGRIFLLLPFF